MHKAENQCFFGCIIEIGVICHLIFSKRLQSNYLITNVQDSGC